MIFYLKMDFKKLDLINLHQLNLKLFYKYYENNNDQALIKLNNKAEFKNLEIKFFNDLNLLRKINEPIIFKSIVNSFIELQHITSFYSKRVMDDGIYLFKDLLNNENKLELIYNIYLKFINNYEERIKLARKFYLNDKTFTFETDKLIDQLIIINHQLLNNQLIDHQLYNQLINHQTSNQLLNRFLTGYSHLNYQFHPFSQHHNLILLSNQLKSKKRVHFQDEGKYFFQLSIKKFYLYFLIFII